MIGNIITAVFSGSRTCKTSPLYQYDYGQKMDFRGISGLPVPYEVHFSNQEHGSSKTAIGDETGVIIPDEYLTSGENIYAWIYLHTGADDGETEYRITIPVIKRARPSDAEPTPVQQDVITQTIAALNTAVEKVSEAVANSPKIEDETWRVWDADHGVWVDTGVKAEGIDGVSPVISTEPIENGHKITFTDKEGTHIITLTNGAKGETGATGPQGETGSQGPAGQDGRDGQDGAPGTPGADGYSPTASVSKSGSTATITITDKNGTTTAQVNDGSQGPKGDTGNAGPAGADGDDGITPTTTVTTITGGHNVAFSYGSGDARNTDFDVMDGSAGHTPVVTASKTGKVTTVSVDGTAIATINDGEDGPSGEATVETVSGTNPVITGVANTRYICGEVSTISITPPQSGIIDVIFTSGSSVAVLTVPNTVLWSNGFDPTSLETNTTYELNIMDGVYGAVMSWT